jgi:hypothetical protein
MKQATTASFQALTICTLQQKCTNPGCKVTRAAKFYKVVPHILGSSLSHLDNVTYLTPRIFRFLPDLGKYVQRWFRIIVPFKAP